jgi:hypothetical protein
MRFFRLQVFRCVIICFGGKEATMGRAKRFYDQHNVGTCSGGGRESDGID